MSSGRGPRAAALVVGLCGAAALAHGAAAPPGLAAGPKAKLAERDRLEGQLPGLLQKGDFEQALRAAGRIAALDKEVLGEAHPRAVASLERLAGLHEDRDQFAEAGRLRAEVLRLLE